MISLDATVNASPSAVLPHPHLQADRGTRSIFSLVDRTPLVDAASPAGDKPSAPARGALEFRDVTFRYPTRPDGPPALNKLNLVVRPGQKVALVGAYCSCTLGCSCCCSEGCCWPQWCMHALPLPLPCCHVKTPRAQRALSLSHCLFHSSSALSSSLLLLSHVILSRSQRLRQVDDHLPAGALLRARQRPDPAGRRAHRELQRGVAAQPAGPDSAGADPLRGQVRRSGCK